MRCANTPRGMAVPIRKAPNTACNPMTSETYADKVHNIRDDRQHRRAQRLTGLVLALGQTPQRREQSRP